MPEAIDDVCKLDGKPVPYRVIPDIVPDVMLTHIRHPDFGVFIVLGDNIPPQFERYFVYELLTEAGRALEWHEKIRGKKIAEEKWDKVIDLRSMSRGNIIPQETRKEIHQDAVDAGLRIADEEGNLREYLNWRIHHLKGCMDAVGKIDPMYGHFQRSDNLELRGVYFEEDLEYLRRCREKAASEIN